MEKLMIIKVGGNVVDDENTCGVFLDQFSRIHEKKILVHGGGKKTTELAARLDIPQTMVDGRRVTNSETLQLAVMVYAGLINKSMVAQLQARGCNALGLCGADLNSITAVKRDHPAIDFGWVGDVSAERINTDVLETLLVRRIVPVFSALTHDKQGHLLNTNADTLASKLAVALSEKFSVSLIYCLEKRGVLADPEDEDSVMGTLSDSEFRTYRNSKKISAGMLPKLESAFEAKQAGVHQVIVGNALQLEKIIEDGKNATLICA